MTSLSYWSEMKLCPSTGMLPLQNLDRKWMFVDGFHRLPGSFSLFYVCGCTLPDQYYCEFLWSWEKLLWKRSTVQPKNTVCHSSSKGSCRKNNRLGPYTNDWERVTKRMVDFDHFEKVDWMGPSTFSKGGRRSFLLIERT